MTKKIFSTILLLFVIFMSDAQQRFSASLEEATVYLRGAELKHTTSAALKSGSYDVYIDGISPNIELNSLKVKANGVLISAVEFSNDFMTPKEESQKIQKLKDSLEFYRSQLTDVQNDLAVQRQLLKILTDATNSNMNQKEHTVSVADITANMELYKSKAASIQKLIDQDNNKIDKLNATIGRLSKQVAQDETKNRQKTGLLRIAVSVPEKVNTKFTVTYFTSNAAWTPCYDINIPSMANTITLQAKAQVRQTTGLDWNNVKLTLSNAVPNRSSEAPVLSTWFLSFNNFRRPGLAVKNNVTFAKTTAANAEAAFEEDVAYDAAPATLEPIMMDDYVDVDEQEIHVNYNISVPYNVPGNGKSQLVDLKSYQIKSDFHYYSVPKAAEETYLMAVLSDYQQYNLLPGYATVSYNNTFVGKTYIQPNSAEKEFRLTLATEPRIAVKREKHSEFCSTKSVGNNTTVTQSYMITVKNNQTKAVTVKLKDQYPISSDKDIEVKVVDINPAPNINNSDTGIITWDAELKAGETKTFVITYSVKYPKDKQLSL